MNSDSIENSFEDQAPVGVLGYAYPVRINLSSSEDIRREMARVYREARSGKIPISDATKFSYILTQILKAYEMTILESRLEVLEINK